VPVDATIGKKFIASEKLLKQLIWFHVGSGTLIKQGVNETFERTALPFATWEKILLYPTVEASSLLSLRR